LTRVNSLPFKKGLLADQNLRATDSSVEAALLAEHAFEICRLTDARMLVELGSSSAASRDHRRHHCQLCVPSERMKC